MIQNHEATRESSRARTSRKEGERNGGPNASPDGTKATPGPSAPGSRTLRGLEEIILDRRATAHFTDQAVDPETLDYVLRLAGQAPSGYNLQPWRFIVVRSTDGRARLKKVAMDQEKVLEAPVVVIAVGMKKEPLGMAEEILSEGARRGAGDAEDVADTAAQARKFLSSFPMDVWVNRHTMIGLTFLMLAAEACGLDTAPMEGMDPEAVKREFQIPEEGDVVALLAIGHAKKPDKPYPGRLAVSRIAFQETFGVPWDEGSSSKNTASTEFHPTPNDHSPSGYESGL